MRTVVTLRDKLCWVVSVMHNKQRGRSTGQIRIIGGQWRGRKLTVPESAGLRPTTDRIRETLFNWLAPYLSQARCLDCYAGSGALGLEALSRFANSVTLLELERTVARELGKNLSVLKAENAQVINTDTLNWLAHPGEPFNIVFVDPPFRKGLIERTCWLLEQYHWLADGAFIYLESESEGAAPDVPVNWQLFREKRAGQVACRLYIRHSESEETDNVT